MKIFGNDKSEEKKLDSVAIIMDGNGRWAKAGGLDRTAGHKAGAKIVQGILEHFRDLGIHHVTLYAFSTENWKRPKHEVDMLMELFYHYLDTVVLKIVKEDESFCMRMIGDKSQLSEKLKNKCIEIEQLSAGRPFVCNVAFNYGGRADIVNAANAAIKDGHTELTEEILSRYVYTAGSPDPDLVIRTGGDFRVSNFLLWQIAYSEFIILDTLWPDFTNDDIDRCIEHFYKRNRRFGGLDPDETNKA